MAQSHIMQSGTLKWTNSTGASIASGAPIDLGGRAGIAGGTIANAAEGTVFTGDVWEIAKDTSTITAEDVLYWDLSESKVTTSPAAGVGDFRLGIAAESAATGATYVKVDLNAPETVGRTAITYPASGAGDATANQTAISAILAQLKVAGIVEE